MKSKTIPPNASSDTGSKVIFGALVLLLLTAVFAWLSAAFFLLLLKKNPLGQANFTLWLAHWDMVHD